MFVVMENKNTNALAVPKPKQYWTRHRQFRFHVYRDAHSSRDTWLYLIQRYELRRTVNRGLAVLLAALSPLAVQAAESPSIGAGSILQQVQPGTFSVPSSNGTDLTIEKGVDTKPPASGAFEVKHILILGNTLFDTPLLHALVADSEGKYLTLDQLDELAARVGNYYHDHGYPLARVVTPAQIVQSGAVRILVIEARYGKVGIDNRTRVNDVLMQATMSPLQSGKIIGQAELDKSLLLLSDIPGVIVNATLKPGEAVGTSDLMVNALPGPAISGNAVLDDYGNGYTGRVRMGGAVNFSNLLHHGDVLSVNGLSSGSELNYARVAYESLLNGEGTRLGGSYSSLSYRLGDSLASLEAHGTAKVENLWMRYPLVRSQDFNLYGQVQYDQLQLREHIDASAIRTDRNLNNWTLSLVGDARDAWLSGGVNTWSTSWTAGQVNFDDKAAQQADATTARTQGGYSRLNLNFARLQDLGSRASLYLSVAGQWASTNLDASQKMSLGGPYSVRAYDVGAVSGDIGYRGTIEVRYDLGQAWHGKWQAVAFIDSAHVTVNQSTWTTGVNNATLSGAGVGLNWTGQSLWSAKTYLAVPMGSQPVLVKASNSSRVWTEIDWRF